MSAVDGTRSAIRSAIRSAPGYSRRGSEGRPAGLTLGVTLGLSLALNPSWLVQSAHAQQTQQGRPVDIEEVVVSGFRQSLNVALDEKRAAAGAIDAIVAEDIADFPDLNLAESIQRIPGVAIARDAGEGRQISVRGLSPEFTRVRLNGIEAMSANGGTDAAGGTNRTRGFDFNTFASELFNSITVRKSASAEVKRARWEQRWTCARGAPSTTTASRSRSPARANTTIWREMSIRVRPCSSAIRGWMEHSARCCRPRTRIAASLDGRSSTVRWGLPSANGNFGGLAANYAGTATLAQLNRVRAAHSALRLLRAQPGSTRRDGGAAMGAERSLLAQPRRARTRSSTPSAPRSSWKCPTSAPP